MHSHKTLVCSNDYEQYDAQNISQGGAKDVKCSHVPGTAFGSDEKSVESET